MWWSHHSMDREGPQPRGAARTTIMTKGCQPDVRPAMMWSMDAATKDRAVGAVMASAVGDALGAPYEFYPPNPAAPCVMEGGGGFGWEPGEWTDDTQMALAVLTVLARGSTD